MMYVKHKLEIDLSGQAVMPRVDMVEGDQYARQLELSLLCGGESWEIPEDVHATVRFRKPDGTGGEYDSLPDGSPAWSASGNVLTVELAPQVLSCPGNGILSVVLTQGDARVSTFHILFQVHGAIPGGLESEDYFCYDGLLNAPKNAEIGQFLKVSGVNGHGIVSQVEAVTIPPLDEAVDTALAQAKESGEFDGASAYEIAQNNGFTGTEAEWLESLCAKYDIAHQPGTVDIGVRVEVRNEVMEEVNSVLYESKLVGYPQPFKNKVRTFCQNPGGFVSQENYDKNLAVVNGHSYKDLKSDNTNLSILCSHNFTYPFNQPIAYAQKVGELTNMLADGHILVQRFGDILDGKRTWPKELAFSNVRPTLPDAVAGDITAGMPYRAMINIIGFIQAMDQVVPGFASYETLLYSPELKFYSNKVKMTPDLKTNVAHLYCLGDSSGWTRGLMMASAMGVLMGRKLAGYEEPLR